jgi:hypothetical protein
MSVYKTKVFARFARKNGLSDEALSVAADAVSDGNFDANLGGGLYKQRVARSGGGKSGGFRTLITHKTSEHIFFVYGFGKKEKDNIDAREEKALKAMAKTFGELTQAQLALAVESGEFEEVHDD